MPKGYTIKVQRTPHGFRATAYKDGKYQFSAVSKSEKTAKMSVTEMIDERESAEKGTT